MRILDSGLRGMTTSSIRVFASHFELLYSIASRQRHRIWSVSKMSSRGPKTGIDRFSRKSLARSKLALSPVKLTYIGLDGKRAESSGRKAYFSAGIAGEARRMAATASTPSSSRSVSSTAR